MLLFQAFNNAVFKYALKALSGKLKYFIIYWSAKSHKVYFWFQKPKKAQII